MIHRYRVKNFKSIRDVCVDLEPVTVLVGKSGTGKSNFIDSLKMLRSLISKRESDIYAQARGVSHLQERDLPLSFELEFSISGIEERFSYLLSLTSSTVQQGLVIGGIKTSLEEKLTLGREVVFHQNADKWVEPPKTTQDIRPGRIAIGGLPSLRHVVLAFTAITSGIGAYDFSDTVLTNGKFDPAASGLDDEAKNYLGVLQDITNNLQDLRVRSNMIATLQRVNPSIQSVELDRVQKPSNVIVGHVFEQNDKVVSLNLSQESAGMRRFYAHLLALYQRPPKQTICFEHPEDGIHPGAMSLLAEEMLMTPDDGRGQVVFTTHNPALLDHFESEQIRVVELAGDETKIGRLSSEQHEALLENLLEPGELLTTDPARIEGSSSEASAS